MQKIAAHGGFVVQQKPKNFNKLQKHDDVKKNYQQLLRNLQKEIPSVQKDAWSVQNITSKYQ